MVGSASWSRMSSWVNRVEKYIGGHNTACCRPTDSLIDDSRVQKTKLLNTTHQKCNVSVFKEVPVVPYERTSVAPAPGYILADVHVLVPLGSITREVTDLTRGGRDSTAWGAPCRLGFSELSENMELKEAMDGIFEKLGEAVCSLPLQETMRVAIR